MIRSLQIAIKLFGILLLSCTSNQHTENTNLTTIAPTIPANPDSVSNPFASNAVEPVETSKDTAKFVLYEDGLNDFELGFSNNFMQEKLEENFPECKISKELDFDPQTGSQNNSVNLYLKGSFIGQFKMEEEDSLKLMSFSSNNPMLKDQYGLGVGDLLSDIKLKRKENLIIEHNYYSGSRAYYRNSNIQYRIYGETEQLENPPIPPTPVDPSMKDWKITELVFIKE